MLYNASFKEFKYTFLDLCIVDVLFKVKELGMDNIQNKIYFRNIDFWKKKNRFWKSIFYKKIDESINRIQNNYWWISYNFIIKFIIIIIKLYYYFYILYTFFLLFFLYYYPVLFKVFVSEKKLRHHYI